MSAARKILTPTENLLRYGCDYLTNATKHQDSMVRLATAVLAGVEFDTFVGTGVSGSIAVPVLAYAMKKTFLVVRKARETGATDLPASTHSAHMLEGFIGTRWIFVDDLVASGSTFERVRRQIGDKSDYVGIYLYGANDGFSSSANGYHPKGTFTYSGNTV